jgi:hypothetical protein
VKLARWGRWVRWGLEVSKALQARLELRVKQVKMVQPDLREPKANLVKRVNLVPPEPPVRPAVKALQGPLEPLELQAQPEQRAPPEP